MDTRVENALQDCERELIRGLKSHRGEGSKLSISLAMLKRWKDDLRPYFNLRLQTQEGNDEPQYSWRVVRRKVTRASFYAGATMAFQTQSDEEKTDVEASHMDLAMAYIKQFCLGPSPADGAGQFCE